jgi:glycyl-tRNA synthetase beta chain
MPDLLIELFSEEIPARMQARAREDLKKLVTDGLVEAGLTYASAGAFSTPRRLVLSVEGLTAESRAVREERKGPATTAPAQAVEGFLRSTGLTLDQLERRADKKGETFYAVVEKPGRKAEVIVAEVLEATIRTFPWPKSMRWGNGTLRWVRPLQSILCLLTDEAGAQVVPLTVDGITAGNTTEGHRFMGIGRFTVSGFDDYAVKLKRAHVVLDAGEREASIWQGAQNLAFAAGMEVVPDAGLLAEVAGLVEWPVPLMGRIGEAFLDLPPEVLQTSMKEHQKFFSVKNPKTGRIEGFITVANIEAADGGAVILKGNQKVLSARLSDAKFFWENDLRVVRAPGDWANGEWAEGLKSVTFQAKLGSQAERVERIAALAREIAPLVGADALLAERAARLAKLDLRSAMVGEFPELQGVMGRYYALAAEEKASIADAARDHWRPKGESDSVPTDPVSVAVALADKIDTLTGFWAIDEKPTGSKDPYALRRAALGVIRLVLGNEINASIIDIIWEKHWRRISADIQKVGKGAWAEGIVSLPDGRRVDYRIADLLSFFQDRLKVFLKDDDIRHDCVDACLGASVFDNLLRISRIAPALRDFLKTEDGANLLQGYKRANNILTQAEQKDGVEYSYGADVKFAETEEERALFAALDRAEATITPAMAKEDFATAMAAMAALRPAVDAFFTAVQVNSDNQIVRRNRLNLLSRIRTICSGVADLSRIEG